MTSVEVTSLRLQAIDEFEKYLKSEGTWYIEKPTRYTDDIKLQPSNTVIRNYRHESDSGCIPIDIACFDDKRFLWSVQFETYYNDPINRCRRNGVYYINPEQVMKYRSFKDGRLISGKPIDGRENFWARCEFRQRIKGTPECGKPHYHNGRCEGHYNSMKEGFHKDPSHNPETGARIDWTGPTFNDLCYRYGEPPCAFQSICKSLNSKIVVKGGPSLYENPELFLKKISYLDPKFYNSEKVRKIRDKCVEDIYNVLPVELKLKLEDDVNQNREVTLVDNNK